MIFFIHLLGLNFYIFLYNIKRTLLIIQDLITYRYLKLQFFLL